MLVAGGLLEGPNAAELYSLADGKWTDAGMVDAVRFNHTASLLPDGNVLLAGGFGETTAALDTEMRNVFVPGQTRWSAVGNLGVARGDQTATVLRDGRVLVAGGRKPRVRKHRPRQRGTVWTGLSAGTIGAAFTGAWYDPAQSGHGIFLQILPNNAVFLGWFAFDPSGTQQVWFGGVGTYAATSRQFPHVDMPTGGRWIPNFDPAQIVHNAWGTLVLTFTDCNHGRVDFNSVLGYGTGSMNLTRLTLPAGLTCPRV